MNYLGKKNQKTVFWTLKSQFFKVTFTEMQAMSFFERQVMSFFEQYES